MRRIPLVFLLLGTVALAEPAVGATLTVRKDGTGDYDTIQGGLDVAAVGDTILIGPGEYLDETSFRPPGHGFDVRTFGQIKSDGITIVGAGVGQTIIGPTGYINDGVQFNPRGLTYTGVEGVRILNLTIRNCMVGVWMRGTLFLENCELRDNATGFQWESVGPGGWVKNTEFAGIQHVAVFPTSISILGLGSDIVVLDCTIENALVSIKGIQNVSFERCEIRNHIAGFAIYSDSYVIVRNCNFSEISITGIDLFNSGGTCEIWDSVVSGGLRALRTNPGGRFLVENSVLIGGSTAVVYATQNPGPCVINNCDLVKGDGPVILCDDTISPVTHDLTNNYWGTTEASDIEEWIIDINDDPGVLATVLFEPFSTDPLPVDEGQKSFGGVKAMFR